MSTTTLAGVDDHLKTTVRIGACAIGTTLLYSTRQQEMASQSAKSHTVSPIDAKEIKNKV